MGSRPSVPSAAAEGPSAITVHSKPSANPAVVPATATAATATSHTVATSSSSESPSLSMSSSAPLPVAPPTASPLPLNAAHIAAAALRAATSTSPDCLPSPNSTVLPAASTAAAARRSSAIALLDTDDVAALGGAGVGGSGGSGGGAASGVTPPSVSSSVSLMSTSSQQQRSVFAALPPIVSPSSTAIPITFSPVLHSDRSLSINMRRGSSMQSQSPLSPAIRVQPSPSPLSSFGSHSSSSPSVVQPSIPAGASFSGVASGVSSFASLASFPSSSSPLSPPSASPSAGPSSFPSLLPSVSASPASSTMSVAHPSTVLATFAAPSVNSAPSVAHKERSVAASGGAGRLIPRIFSSGRRKADKGAPDSKQHSSHTAAAPSEQDGDPAKESEETKELSATEQPGPIAAIQAVRGKVKSNSVAPQPLSPQTRQPPSSAVLEWKEGSPNALPALPSAPLTQLEPIAHSYAAAPSSPLPLSATAASPAPLPPSAAENLPPLRSHPNAGSAALPPLPHSFLSASSDSSASAPLASAAPSSALSESASSEGHNALPLSLAARLAPHILLTSSSSSSSAPSTDRNHANLAVPSPVSPSPSSSSPSPSQSSMSKSSHRTSIAQYIDYERRHAAEAQYHLHRKRQHQLKLQQSKQTGGAPDELQSLSVVYLPRGGIYVHTPAGPVQFGMPPETIKDSMSLGLTLPAFFVVPKERFNLAAGINVAEFEFPAYYNFFFKRRRINLITTHSVEPLIRTVFRETLLGPSKVDWPAEYGESVPKRCYPDLQKEMAHFSVNPFDKSPLTVDSLLAFTHFDDSGRVQLGQGVAIQDAGEEYVVTVGVKQEDGSVVEREIARVRQEVFSTPLLDDRDRDRAAAAQQQGGSKAEADSVEYFVPPQFGLTMLGNSDGFDSTGTTTGFVLWMNRRGIMVDPPPHSGALLKRHGISARLMRGVILTHCHADHDAGTFQKILEEGKVVLMTTEVILDSFLRKYSAISGLDAQFLRKLFVFRPVLAGQRTAVYGGHVEFFYSLHSIPCVGFSAYCNGRSFVYSADSFNDPAGIRALYEKGYVSEGRRDKLINFPWHHDLILHEAGVPPIHTPLATLEALPDDVKQRLYIVHKPSKDVPTDKGLKSALVGPQNTLVISTDVPPNGRALEVLDLLSGIELFSGFDLSRALEILQCASFVEFNKGATLIAEGTYGNAGGPPCMYVIAMGTVAVEQDGAHIKQLTVGDHFGEMSIITGEKRTASVKALTPVEVIQFSKQEFLYIVRHTDAISRLQQLGVIQRSPSWQAISANSALSQLSSAQKTYLQSLFVHRLVEQGDTVWQAGDPATEAVLIADGQFYFSRAKEQPPFTRGALVGEMRALIAANTLSTTLQCAESGSVFAITRPQLCKFFDDNPGVQILFMNRRFIE